LIRFLLYSFNFLFAVYLYSEYSSLENLGSPLTGMTETGLETTFMDLLRLAGRAGFSGICTFTEGKNQVIG
jgi:hypothetical protein